MGDVMAHLRARLPDDAIIATGAGNFTVWAHRFYEFRRYPSQLAPRSGAMGYGLPAAVAAKIAHPERTVVCIAGDGDFLMTGQELATAVQYEAPIVVLVVDNGMYGTIRMHQERHFPGRVSGTDLAQPRLRRARARVRRPRRARRAHRRAPGGARAGARSGLPSVLHLLVDPEAITPRRTLTEIRERPRSSALVARVPERAIRRGRSPRHRRLCPSTDAKEANRRMARSYASTVIDSARRRGLGAHP